MTAMTDTENDPPRELPPGDYAIIELFGHIMLAGRIAEIERFGTKMLAIEPLYRGELLPPVFYGGGSIYGLTPCSAEIAHARSPRENYQLPPALRATLPQEALPAPEADEIDDERPF